MITSNSSSFSPAAASPATTCGEQKPFNRAPAKRAWEESCSSRAPTLTRTLSPVRGISSNRAKIHPDYSHSVSTATSSTLMHTSSQTATVGQTNSLITVKARLLTDQIQTLLPIVLLNMITEYAPNPALLVNRALKTYLSASISGLIIYQKFLKTCNLQKEALPLQINGRPNYRTIGANLPRYHKMIEDEYRKRAPYFKYENYTPPILRQTIPLGIFSATPRDSCHINIDWHIGHLEQRKIELNSYVAGIIPSNQLLRVPSDLYALRKVSYFLSIPLTLGWRTLATDIFTKPEIIKERLVGDPTFVNRLFRYIADQIHGSTFLALAYHESLYNMVEWLLGHHANNLSYYVLHYTLLIHVHIILLYANSDESKLRLIDSILEKIKLAAEKTASFSNELPALEQQLQALFTHEQQAAKKMDKSSYSMERLAEEHEKSLQGVGKIIKKHFTSFSVESPTPTSESGCCIIS